MSDETRAEEVWVVVIDDPINDSAYVAGVFSSEAIAESWAERHHPHTSRAARPDGKKYGYFVEVCRWRVDQPDR